MILVPSSSSSSVVIVRRRRRPSSSSVVVVIVIVVIVIVFVVIILVLVVHRIMTSPSTISSSSEKEDLEEEPRRKVRRRKRFCRFYQNRKARLEDYERREALRQIALWRESCEYPKEWRRATSDEDIQEKLQLEENAADDEYWRNFEMAYPEEFVEIQKANYWEFMKNMSGVGDEDDPSSWEMQLNEEIVREF